MNARAVGATPWWQIDSADERHVRVAVRDNGPGISEDNLPKLFEAFFTTKAEGMGMGLAICRSTIEAHHGHLTARNHEDGGAIFEFVLPVEAEVERTYA